MSTSRARRAEDARRGVRRGRVIVLFVLWWWLVFGDLWLLVSWDAGCCGVTYREYGNSASLVILFFLRGCCTCSSAYGCLDIMYGW